ncbi:MAG: L-threonylcarbamoyladenylate synthase [Candidatus Caenarcaniphilales bacterium]|nr:L-threonylcarbamoyladenylate synthase [Candidatus Caenarcaniphilales bacterium]
MSLSSPQNNSPLITDSPQIASEFLMNGEVVAFPTETVFGLGALIKFEEAVKKIYKLKGRPQDNPLIIHIADLSQIEALVEEVPEEAQKLIKAFWPGALTLIFKKKSSLSNSLTCGLKTVAVRMPSHRLARELIRLCDCPVAAPSANLSGKPSATKTEHVLQDFEGKIPCILKGETVFGLESTVVDCSSKPFRILRQGSVSEEEIKKILSGGFFSSKEKQDEKDFPKSPGMKYRHYSPKAEIVLFSKDQELLSVPPFSALIGINVGLSDFEHKNLKTKFIAKDLEDYAKNLFAFFRECDQRGIATILCELPPEEGIGKALVERLKKAASD